MGRKSRSQRTKRKATTQKIRTRIKKRIRARRAKTRTTNESCQGDLRPSSSGPRMRAAALHRRLVLGMADADGHLPKHRFPASDNHRREWGGSGGPDARIGHKAYRG